jgi:PhnB protein
MSTQSNPRKGFSTVTPYLTVADAQKQLDFVTRVFGAEPTFLSRRPDGTVWHAEARIGGSMLMIGQAQGQWQPRPSTLYIYVEDVDATCRAALEAGAQSLAEPQNHDYGDRSGGFEDPCGNFWWAATVIEELTNDEILDRMKAGSH